MVVAVWRSIYSYYAKTLLVRESLASLDIRLLTKSIEFVVIQLISVTDKGYLNNQDLSSYLIISDLIKVFTENKEYIYIRGKFVHISYIIWFIYLSITWY